MGAAPDLVLRIKDEKYVPIRMQTINVEKAQQRQQSLLHGLLPSSQYHLCANQMLGQWMGGKKHTPS
eukprot:4197816-Pleurochrysis_carterae.AAC.1